MKRTRLLLLLPALCLSIALSGCDQASPPATSAPASSLADKPTDPTPTSAVPSPTDQGQAFATAKAQFELDHESTRVAEITAEALLPTRPIPTYPPAGTPEPLPTGVRDPSNLGVHICDCIFERTAWTGVQDNWYLNIYAGHFEYDPDQGLVMLDSRTLDLHTSRLDFFATPTRSGSVHVVSADGLRVTLLSTDGTQFVFDAGLRAWIPPSGTPVPAPTIYP